MYMYATTIDTRINMWKCASWSRRCRDFRRHTNMVFEAVKLSFLSFCPYPYSYKKCSCVCVYRAILAHMIVASSSIHVHIADIECRKHRGDVYSTVIKAQKVNIHLHISLRSIHI